MEIDEHKERITKHMINHYSQTKSESEIRKEIEENPQILDDYEEWLANDFSDMYYGRQTNE